MIKICPICGKKHKIICHSQRALRYSIYERITEYKCSGCGGNLQRCKDMPTTIEHIAILLLSLIVAVTLCLLSEDYVTNILIACFITFLMYYFLGLKDAYYAKKIIPVDENNNPLILKADIAVKLYKNRKTPQKYDVIQCKENDVNLFCVQYYKEKETAMCYCLSGNISEILNKKIKLYVNDKLICDNAVITTKPIE